jgi:hypothetical protein
MAQFCISSYTLLRQTNPGGEMRTQRPLPSLESSLCSCERSKSTSDSRRGRLLFYLGVIYSAIEYRKLPYQALRMRWAIVVCDHDVQQKQGTKQMTIYLDPTSISKVRKAND